MPFPVVQELIQSLELPNKVELYKLTLGSNTIYFTSSIKVVGETLQQTWWNGNRYLPYPVSITGIGYTQDNLSQTPKITLSNVGQSYNVLFASIPRLEGAKLEYIETFETYISSSNVGNSSSYISRHFFKVSKFVSKVPTKHIIYELDPPGKLETFQFPRRRILREGEINLRFEGAGINKTRG